MSRHTGFASLPLLTDACDRIGRDAQPLVYASRTSAKVDSAAVQDGYQLYHHVAHENDPVRAASAQLARQPPEVTLRALPFLEMPSRHPLLPGFDVASRHLEKILLKTYERAPENFEALLGIEGVGPKTLRALALASELVHGTPATMRDPARFSFAHGGKDGTPFPVDQPTYDRTIEILHTAINKAAIDRSEKVKAFQRLAKFTEPTPGRSRKASARR